MTHSAFDRLVECAACRHGMTLHDHTGCLAVRCRCVVTREQVMREALEAAQEEQRDVWRAFDDRSR